MMKKTIIRFIFLSLILPPLHLVVAQDASLIKRLEQHAFTLADDSMAGRKAGSAAAAVAAEYIVRQFEQAGIQPFGDEYLQPFNPDMFIGKAGKTFTNVIGVIRGSDDRLKNEYIVVGAHYDHIGTQAGKVYNGADDNASGVAVLIETGRKLVQERDKLKRSVIIVAFDAEEMGLLGSNYFVKDPPVPFGKIKLMLSLDMVGWLGQGDGTLHYNGTGTLKNGAQVLDDQGIVPRGMVVETKKFESGLMIATDTEPFAVRGVPTFHVTTGFESPYHKPEDDPDKLDYYGMTDVVSHVAGAVRGFAAEEKLESSGQRSFKHDDYDKVFEAGITGTVGPSSLNYSSGPYRGRTSASFGGGLYTQINMGVLGLRSELLYEHGVMPYPDGKLRTNSLTVPVSLVLQTPKSFVGGMYLAAGGYYRYTFSGKAGGVEMDFDNVFHRNESGLQWGLGLWLYHINIGVNFRYGLTGLLREPADAPRIKTRSTSFAITYIF